MKIFTGKVVSTALNKTVTVMVVRRYAHPVYGKSIEKKGKFLCHDTIGVKMGEMVTIQETRPISAKKKFIIIGKVEKA